MRKMHGLIEKLKDLGIINNITLITDCNQSGMDPNIKVSEGLALKILVLD